MPSSRWVAPSGIRMTGRLRGEGLKDGRLRRPRALCARGKQQTALDRHQNCPQIGKPSARFLLHPVGVKAKGQKGANRTAKPPAFRLHLPAKGDVNASQAQSDGEASSLPVAKPAAPSGRKLLPGQARCHKGKRAPIASDCGGGDRPPKGSKHQLCWSRALS